MSATSVWDQMPSTGTNTLDCCRLEAAGFHKDVLQRLMTIKPCQNVVKHISIESTKKTWKTSKKSQDDIQAADLQNFWVFDRFLMLIYDHGPFWPFWWLASSKLKYKSLSQAASFRRCFLERWANEVRQHGTVHFRTRDSARPCSTINTRSWENNLQGFWTSFFCTELLHRCALGCASFACDLNPFF